MVQTIKAKLKKKINSDIGKQNVVKGKRLKGRLEVYAGFFTNVTNNQSLSAQKLAFNIGLIFYKKLHHN